MSTYLIETRQVKPKLCLVDGKAGFCGEGSPGFKMGQGPSKNAVLHAADLRSCAGSFSPSNLLIHGEKPHRRDSRESYSSCLIWARFEKFRTGHNDRRITDTDQPLAQSFAPRSGSTSPLTELNVDAV